MKKLQQIYQIDDIKISRKKISGQLFRSRKTAEPLPEYQPWEEQSYNGVTGLSISIDATESART